MDETARFINKSLVINQIPLFNNLKPKKKELIAKRSSLVEHKKGQIIYKQGDPPDAFYCIVLGRVAIYVIDPQGKENMLEYLHRGSYFGIISLLTGEGHSVYSRTLNDSILLKIDKKDFDFLLANIPELAIDLSLTLSRRLKRKDVQQKKIFESTVIAVYGPTPGNDKTIYSTNLALSLRKETGKNVIIIDISPKGDKVAKLLNPNSGPNSVNLISFDLQKDELLNHINKNISGIDLLNIAHIPTQIYKYSLLTHILSYLTNDYHFIIIDLPYQIDEVVFSTLIQADLIHILTGTSEESLNQTRQLLERLKKETKHKQERLEILISNPKEPNPGYQNITTTLKHPIKIVLPDIEPQEQQSDQTQLVITRPDCEYSKSIRLISREVGDILVGLALGSGAAFGLAHIGVLKVFEKEKIPIDVVSGSSIGSMIAAFWAIGKSAEEIQNIFIQVKNKKIFVSIEDLTIPRISFFRGKKMAGFLRMHLGKKTFNDVKIPLKILCCDIRNKQELIIEEGDLVEAVLASMAMPGIFRPIIKEKLILMDGGILSPLPTNSLVKLGVKKILAVNVIPAPEDVERIREKLKQREEKELQEINQKPFLKRKVMLFKRALLNLYNQNILDFIFTGIETMQYVLVKLGIQQADITLHPDTSGLNWFEFSQAEELIKRGEQEAQNNLSRIKEIINE